MPSHRYVSLAGRPAFSLVELSIVLVILGLLVGGILTGQALIRAAELRAVSGEYQRYLSAVHGFKDKYFGLPGDLSNAVSFWGASTVNSDGNGELYRSSAGGLTGETYQFWNQLALAGLIEGTYSGLAGAGGTYHMIIGTNIPASKLKGTGWGVREYAPVMSGSTHLFDGNYGNWLQVGGTTSNSDNYTAVFKPEELWNLDVKLDDGMPGTGKLVARGAVFTSALCSNAANSAALTATYNLNSSAVECVAIFRRLFN